MKDSNSTNRRNFMKSFAVITSGSIGLSSMPHFSMATTLPIDERINVIGPREGFSTHIGTLVSMMSWMRMVILMPVKGMSVEQLGFLLDENSNSIGAMLLHLAATERFYQIFTLEGKQWEEVGEQDLSRFEVAMNLGKEARETIKGNNLEYYLDVLSEVREHTIQEFKKRDDAWLFSVDNEWGWGPTNNYCKWFHVCEHESNHNGQFKYIKSRFPGGIFSKEKV